MNFLNELLIIDYFMRENKEYTKNFVYFKISFRENRLHGFLIQSEFLHFKNL